MDGLNELLQGGDPSGPGRWLVPLLLFLAVFIVGLVVRHFSFRALTRWASKTVTPIDDFVVGATRYPSYLWILIAALLVAVQAVNLPGEQADVAVRRTLGALLVLSITLGGSRLFAELAVHYRNKAAGDGGPAPTGLMRTVARGIVLVIGLMIMLATLGINITPLLGALGVGGLAAGLALQPTLTNLFAGFQIAASRQIRIGNRVRLASGEEGWVSDISWRSTTLKTPTNNLIIIPNGKLADSIVTNFSLPEAKSNVVFTFNVSYDSDPRHVEAVLRDEAGQAAAALPQLIRDQAPVVRFQAMGESAIQFNVVVGVRDYDSQFDASSELQTRFFERLRREGIAIPFPTRDLYLKGDVPARLKGSGDGAPASDGSPPSPAGDASATEREAGSTRPKGEPPDGGRARKNPPPRA